jgi:phosphate transport system permease protein
MLKARLSRATYGLAAMLVGTFLSALIAVAIGVPIAVLSALYLTFYARGAVKKFLVSLIDLISSISIITLWFLGLHCFDE